MADHHPCPTSKCMPTNQCTEWIQANTLKSVWTSAHGWEQTRNQQIVRLHQTWTIIQPIFNFFLVCQTHDTNNTRLSLNLGSRLGTNAQSADREFASNVTNYTANFKLFSVFQTHDTNDKHLWLRVFRQTRAVYQIDLSPLSWIYSGCQLFDICLTIDQRWRSPCFMTKCIISKSKS